MENENPTQPNQPTQPTEPQIQPDQSTQPMQQPVQPVQPAVRGDFLTRMDTTMMANNQPQKKKTSKGAIIGAIIGVLVLAGVGVFMMMNSGTKTTSNPTPVTPSTPDVPSTPTSQLSEEIIERNEQRKNDFVELGNALLAYQNDHNGELPGSEVTQWNWMVKNYLPSGITDAATGESYQIYGVCRFGDTCVDIDSLDWDKNQHQIYILINATCNGKTKSNTIVSSTKKRQVAIFSILEGSENILCVSN